MIEYIVYKVDKSFERIDGCKNTTGVFVPDSDFDNLWIRIEEANFKIQKGDLLCISNSDYEETTHYYEVVVPMNGIYKLKRIKLFYSRS